MYSKIINSKAIFYIYIVFPIIMVITVKFITFTYWYTLHGVGCANVYVCRHVLNVLYEGNIIVYGRNFIGTPAVYI